MNEGQGFLRDASQGSLMSVACRVSGKSELLREQVSDPVKHASGAEPAEAPAGRQRSPGRARGCLSLPREGAREALLLRFAAADGVPTLMSILRVRKVTEVTRGVSVSLFSASPSVLRRSWLLKHSRSVQNTWKERKCFRHTPYRLRRTAGCGTACDEWQGSFLVAFFPGQTKHEHLEYPALAFPAVLTV